MLANISKLSCTFRSLERVYLDYVWYALKSMNFELKCLSILEILLRDKQHQNKNLFSVWTTILREKKYDKVVSNYLVKRTFSLSTILCLLSVK